jgi:glycosyltransferase involved in cell wall biosynthesis
MKSIAVIIPTYNRASIIEETIERFMTFAVYPGHIQYYVGCDGDDNTPELLAGDRFITVLEESSGSLGGNLNRLIVKAVNDGFDLLFQMDDDHWLNAPLHLEAHAKKLLEDKKAGWIRLMQIAGHKYVATLEGSYWRVHWDSPEAYIASNRPHLKHIRFHHFYGFYRENETLGRTEEIFSYLCKEKADDDGPNVLIPLPAYTEQIWSHVGKSWQLEGK